MFSPFGIIEQKYLMGKETKSKKPKKTYNNWFERCNVDQLKTLCKASKLPVSGTKAVLCERLVGGELSAPYTYESQRGRKRLFGIGLSNEDLKSNCRESGLSVTGNRYDLVLRLLQNKSGVGGSPKRALCTIDEDGHPQPRKRAKSMTLPNVEKIREKVLKKMFPPRETMFKWSNNKHKYHPVDCINFVNNIIEKEVFEKELFKRGEERLAWEVINAILHRIVHGDFERRKAHHQEQMATNPGGLIFALGGTELCLGRCRWELKQNLFPSIIKAMKATSAKNVVQDLSGHILWEFDRRLGQYSARDDAFTEFIEEYAPRTQKTAN